MTDRAYDFIVEYATDKDTMDEPAGWANVRTAGANYVEAKLLAEQMVACMGVEPVAVYGCPVAR